MIDTINITEKRDVLEYHSEFGKIKYTLPENKTPFIIVLHSLSKNESQSIKLSNILPSNSFVLSVRAPMEWKVNGDDSFAWFDIKGPSIENFTKESDILDSIDYLIKIIDECKEKFKNLDDPIILGFSQGGIVGLTMAVDGYYKMKGVYCHCGFYENKLNKGLMSVETHILMANGVNDYVIPGVWAQGSAMTLQKKCKNFENRFFESGHEITEEQLIVMKNWINKIL